MIILGVDMENIQDITFTSRYWVILLPVILMAADIVTGWLQATINETWDSTKMRKGLFRKSAEILIIVVAFAISAAVKLPVDIPAFIAIYVTVMEILSICENLNQAGLPVPMWITRRLSKVAKDLSEDDPLEDKKKDEDRDKPE